MIANYLVGLNKYAELPMTALPFADEAALDAAQSEPADEVMAALARCPGDLAILGVAGKMGVTMAQLAVRALRRAGSPATVYGVARFSEPGLREQLDRAGVATIACDLLDPDAVARLPDAANVIFLAGRKFGTAGGGEATTWALNALAPANAARRYAGSRIVALSTGCVYPLVEAASGGCDESVPPAPVGEYAMSTLARERVFEHASRSRGTPICLVRLNYALDLRYGVIHDLGRAILAGEAIDLSVPCFNGLWQGDANGMVLRCLERCSAPAAVLNLTGPETAAVPRVARRLAQILGREARFAGTPGPCLLNDAGRALAAFGYPRVALGTVVEWTGGWLAAGGRSFGKPTHFQTTDGRF